MDHPDGSRKAVHHYVHTSLDWSEGYFQQLRYVDQTYELRRCSLVIVVSLRFLHLFANDRNRVMVMFIQPLICCQYSEGNPTVQLLSLHGSDFDLERLYGWYATHSSTELTSLIHAHGGLSASFGFQQLFDLQ